MKALIYASLILNIGVLVPVCYGLVTAAVWVGPAYGPETEARAILLAVYAAILLISFGLLFKPIPAAVAALLLLQIIYKILTPLTLGKIGNPVVVSNLAIAAFHSITLWSIWRAD